MRSANLISSVFAAGAASTALAGLDLGTLVRAIPSSGSSSAITNADPGFGPGSYASDLAGTDFAGRAFAQLAWGASAVTFTGLANGGPDALMRTQGIAMLDFAEAVHFSVVWSMASAVGTGIETSWGLIDASGDGTPTVGVTSVGGSLASFGGPAASATGSFSTTVAAGTYLLVMLSESSASAGQISLSATFAAVPAPSGALLLPLAAWAARRRRRPGR